MIIFEVGDSFRLTSPAYKGRKFVIEHVRDDYVVAIYDDDMKQGTHPDGWRRLILCDETIWHYEEHEQIEVEP